MVLKEYNKLYSLKKERVLPVFTYSDFKSFYSQLGTENLLLFSARPSPTNISALPSSDADHTSIYRH